jgi:hypothetical protein
MAIGVSASNRISGKSGLMTWTPQVRARCTLRQIEMPVHDHRGARL